MPFNDPWLNFIDYSSLYTVNLVKPNLVKPNISLYRIFARVHFRPYRNYLDKPKIHIKIYVNR